MITGCGCFLAALDRSGSSLEGVTFIVRAGGCGPGLSVAVAEPWSGRPGINQFISILVSFGPDYMKDYMDDTAGHFFFF